jgi:hypothetical protein
MNMNRSRVHNAASHWTMMVSATSATGHTSSKTDTERATHAVRSPSVARLPFSGEPNLSEIDFIETAKGVMAEAKT